MTDQPNPMTPVPGYQPQSDENLALVKLNKETEERLLRQVESLQTLGKDGRWLAIAKTHFEQGFMAMNRAIMRPQRIRLPEDPSPPSSGAETPVGRSEHP